MNKAGTCRRNGRRQKAVGRLLVGCLAALFAIVMLRNWAARQTIERLGGRLLATTVRVERVAWSLRGFTICGLEISEPGQIGETLLSVRRIDAVVSLAGGCSGGVWLPTLGIDRPTIRLRVADDGTLLSQLPPWLLRDTAANDQPLQLDQLPLGSLGLFGGSLEIMRGGHTVELVSGLDVRFAAGDTLALTAKASQVIGGSFRLRGAADCDAADGVLALAWQADGIRPGIVAELLGIAPQTGELDLRGSASVPLAQIAKLEQWQATAEGRLREVATAAWQVADTTIGFQAAKGAGRVIVPAAIRSTDEASDGHGHVELIARWQEPESIAFEMLASASVRHQGDEASQVGLSTAKVSLVLNGEVPRAMAHNGQAWQADWKLTASELRIADEPIDDFQVPGRISNGHLEIPAFEVVWNEIPMRANASVDLVPLGQAKGNFQVGPFRLADVAQFAARYSQSDLPLDGSGQADGEIRWRSLGDWTAGGELRLSRTEYSGRPLGDVACHFLADPSRLRLSSRSDDFLGGTYDVAAELKELDWTSAHVTGKADAIRLRRLVELAGLDIPAHGRVSGRIEATSWGDLASLTAVGDISGENLSVAGVAVTLGANELSLRDGQLRVHVVGECCDGRAELKAQADLADLLSFADSQPGQPLDSIPITATGVMTGMSLGRALDSLGSVRSRHGLDGRVHASFVRDAALIADSQFGIANVSLQRVQYRSTQIADRITAAVAVRSDRLRLERLDGRILDGLLRGQGEVTWAAGRPRGRLSVGVERINLRRAAALAPGGSLAAAGSATLQLQAKLDGNVTGRADVHVDNATVADMVVRHSRVPIEWDFAPRSAIARWNCRGGTIELGGGKAIVTSRGEFSGGLSTSTFVKLDRIDTAKLMPKKPAGLGVVDGQVTVHARRATSLNQLQGKFDIDLTKVQPLQIPILDQIPQLIQIPELLQPEPLDDGGYLYGSFGGGTVRLEQLALWQNRIQILADGEATLAGHLNLMVTASTLRGGPADQWLAMAQSPLMLAAPAPIAVLAQANEMLKDRVIHVAVGGTARRPILKLQPGRQLAQQALRFFIRGATGAQLATATDWNQRPRRR